MLQSIVRHVHSRRSNFRSTYLKSKNVRTPRGANENLSVMTIFHLTCMLSKMSLSHSIVTVSKRPRIAARFERASTKTLRPEHALARAIMKRAIRERAARLMSGCRPPKSVCQGCEGVTRIVQEVNLLLYCSRKMNGTWCRARCAYWCYCCTHAEGKIL